MPKISVCHWSLFLLVCRMHLTYFSSFSRVDLLLGPEAKYNTESKLIFTESKGKMLYLKNICINSFQMRLCLKTDPKNR